MTALVFGATGQVGSHLRELLPDAQLVGQAIAPPVYGLLLDLGSPGAVFWVSAAVSMLCLLTIIPRGIRRPAD